MTPRLEREAATMVLCVTIDPGIMGGIPVVSGTRIPVYSLLGRIEEGASVADIEKGMKRVSREAFEAGVGRTSQSARGSLRPISLAGLNAVALHRPRPPLHLFPTESVCRRRRRSRHGGRE